MRRIKIAQRYIKNHLTANTFKYF